MATQGRRSGAQGARCQPSTHIVPSFSLPAALSEILDGAVENENWDPCLILYRYPSIQSSFQCLFFLSVVRGTRVLCFFRLALSRDFCFIRGVLPWLPAAALRLSLSIPRSFAPRPVFPRCPVFQLSPLLWFGYFQQLSTAPQDAAGNPGRKPEAAMQRQEKVRGTLWCMKVSEHSQLRQRPRSTGRR